MLSPAEIKERIPKMFYQALFGEMVSVFGFSWLISCKQYYTQFKDDPDSGYITMVHNYIVGWDECAGWQTAFIQICMKLSMEWHIDYDKTLEWYERDLFYGEISEDLIKSFCKPKGESADEYYKFLVKNQKQIRKVK